MRPQRIGVMSLGALLFCLASSPRTGYADESKAGNLEANPEYQSGQSLRVIAAICAGAGVAVGGFSGVMFVVSHQHAQDGGESLGPLAAGVVSGVSAGVLLATGAILWAVGTSRVNHARR